MIKRKPVIRPPVRTRCRFLLLPAADSIAEQSLRDWALYCPHEAGPARVAGEPAQFAHTMQSSCDPAVSAADQLSALLDKLDAHRAGVTSLLSAGFTLTFEVHVLGQAMFLPFELPPHVARRIADMGANLQIHLVAETDPDASH